MRFPVNLGKLTVATTTLVYSLFAPSISAITIPVSPYTFSNSTTVIGEAVDKLFVAEDNPFLELPIESKAEALNMTADEYDLLTRVIEAESDRNTTGDITGRMMIAVTILNRVKDSRFPDTVYGVLTQSGQFTTVQSGRCNVNSTPFAELAILRAIYELSAGNVPNNVLFFNCIGYNNGTPYGCYGGNYFMTA